MFSNVHETPQRESTPFYPISKVAGYCLIMHYREACNMSCVSSILFNQDSQQGGSEFISCKISGNVAKIKLDPTRELRLGNLEAKRGWGQDSVRCI